MPAKKKARKRKPATPKKPDEKIEPAIEKVSKPKAKKTTKKRKPAQKRAKNLIEFKTVIATRMILMRKPNLEIQKVKKAHEIERASLIRSNPIPSSVKEKLLAKYKENFVTYGTRLEKFLSMGYRLAKVNEYSGFSLRDNTRHLQLREAMRGVTAYVVKEI